MATLAESFMADLADLSDDSASEDEAPQQQQLDGNDLLVSAPAPMLAYSVPPDCAPSAGLPQAAPFMTERAVAPR